MNTPALALSTARMGVGTSQYYFGTGDWDTGFGGNFDCFGFAFCKCYGVKRHRPGFNNGPWATVSDDLNCNSAIEDAQHKRELFSEVPGISQVQPGDLIAYPTYYQDGHPHIGHIAIVDAVTPNPKHYSDLMVIQCCGPNGRKPGILRTNGSHWDQYDFSVKPEHRTHILRPIQSAMGVN